MATSFRLPEDLKLEASAYAARCGVALNAVIKIALRTYLDAAAAPPVPVLGAELQRTRPPDAAASIVPKGNRAQRRAGKKAKR